VFQKVLYENTVYEIASDKHIEKWKYYNINQKIIIDFTSRYNKCEVTFDCKKFDTKFVCKDRYKLIPNNISSHIFVDNELNVEEET